jgi:glutamate N-acetyltransferase / amino-acid N-acetyltransferase
MTDSHSLELPQGFQTAGVTCGIKESGKPDLALFVSDRPAVSAGVFTQNLVCGAPVTVSKSRVRRATSRALVINSGNANACTGQRGLEDALRMTAELAAGLGCDPDDVLVCSTGIIGHFLPMEKLSRGIELALPELGGSSVHLQRAARAIMTTDTVPKMASRAVTVGNEIVRITGVCKGAAMIAPNMATMLSVIMTDAPLSVEQADRLLRQAVDRSFNCISVEGHTSTSDSVILLANAASATGSLPDDGLAQVRSALEEVAAELSQMIVRDAEGAEHFVQIDVSGLASDADAHQIAKAIAEGPLVKTAITGNDPNWGRIVSAAGYVGIPFSIEETSLRVNGFLLYQNGAPIEFDEAEVSISMKTGEVLIDLNCGAGPGEVRFWTCDLTQEYVRLNSEYTT